MAHCHLLAWDTAFSSGMYWTFAPGKSTKCGVNITFYNIYIFLYFVHDSKSLWALYCLKLKLFPRKHLKTSFFFVDARSMGVESTLTFLEAVTNLNKFWVIRVKAFGSVNLWRCSSPLGVHAVGCEVLLLSWWTTAAIRGMWAAGGPAHWCSSRSLSEDMSSSLLLDGHLDSHTHGPPASKTY